MGLFDIFKKKGKYNVKPQNNIPIEVYGIPNVKKYDKKPEENTPSIVYGIPNPEMNNIDKEKTALEKVIIECVGEKDPFFPELLKKYFESEVNYDDNTAIELLRSVAKNKDIFNEFNVYLVKKNYDINNPISVKGITAKELASKHPEKSAIEIYAMLSEQKDKTEEVEGVNIEKYNIEPKENMPCKVYGVPNPSKKEDKK